VTGNDVLTERIANARSAGVAGHLVFSSTHAMESVVDRAVARTAAEITLERARQVGTLLVAERGGRHDHAGRAESALERLCVDEGPLHRMHRAVMGETLDGSDLPPGGAEGGHEAGMNGLAVEPHRAPAAVAGVAALLDAKNAALAQERTQTLTGARLGGKCLGIDRVIHGCSLRGKR
jgi:hypothetical protein